MCRILYVRSENGIDISEYLRRFSEVALRSKEYQGHGWGCGYLVDGEWKVYRSIRPIWEDDLSVFGESTLLVAHARSAFRNEDIVVENTMPFEWNGYLFLFNGELHGVGVQSEGRTGAAKIFQLIQRFYRGDMRLALQKAVNLLEKRTEYVKAMNILIVNDDEGYLYSSFGEDAEYFQMEFCPGDVYVLCSDRWNEKDGWKSVGQKQVRVI